MTQSDRSRTAGFFKDSMKAAAAADRPTATRRSTFDGRRSLHARERRRSRASPWQVNSTRSELMARAGSSLPRTASEDRLRSAATAPRGVGPASRRPNRPCLGIGDRPLDPPASEDGQTQGIGEDAGQRRQGRSAGRRSFAMYRGCDRTTGPLASTSDRLRTEEESVLLSTPRCGPSSPSWRAPEPHPSASVPSTVFRHAFSTAARWIGSRSRPMAWTVAICARCWARSRAA